MVKAGLQRSLSLLRDNRVRTMAEISLSSVSVEARPPAARDAFAYNWPIAIVSPLRV